MRVLIRISVVAVVMAGLTLAVSASAAAAPLQAPLLTSPAFASPVTIHWTPGVDAGVVEDGGGGQGGNGHGRGHGHGHGHGHDHANDDGGTLSVQSVVRAPGPCAAPAGDARALATFLDATTSDFSDPVVDGTYCYWIEVSAGSTAADSPGLTVVVGSRTDPSGGIVASDRVAPPSPGKLACSFARSSARHVQVTIRWTNPAVADLDRVELLINRKHAPRSPVDGRVIYRGLAHGFVLSLRAGQTAHLALYAVDHSGNVSAASRTVVSLAALIPMRPLSGSSVRGAPLLTWEPKKGAAYYNLQVFQRGKRVLLAWTRRTSYHFPAEKLQPGTYVWFVWPAMGGTHAPRFADLIGRATFVYVR